jgi:hypothetical protein
MMPYQSVLLLGLLVMSTASAEDESAQSLLRKAADATAWSTHAHLKVQTSSTFVRGLDGESERDRPLETAVEVFVSGDRYRINRQNAPNEDGSAGTRTETLRSPERRIFWLKGREVLVTEDPALIATIRNFDNMLGAASVLDGRFPLDREPYVLDPSHAVATGQLQHAIQDATLGDLACRVVKVAGDGWKLEAWIVPQRGYNFGQLVFQHDYRGQRSIHTINDMVHQQLPDGRWVVVEGKSRIAWYPNVDDPKRVREVLQEIRREVIDLDPDFEALKAFDLPPIPNGERVRVLMVDEHGEAVDDPVRREWRDGRPVISAHQPDDDDL